MEVHGFGPLDAIYPKIRGQLDPPPEYLSTGAEVRRWRGLSDREQAHEIERLAKKRKKRLASESRSRGRAERIRRREERLAAAPARDTANLERLAAGSSAEAGGVGGRGVSPPAAP